MTAPSGGIAIGSLTVSLTGLNSPNSGSENESINLVDSIKSDNGNNIEAEFNTPSGTCSLTGAGSNGVITINDAHAYPNSAGAIADFYIDFTVDKEMPYGSSVKIKLD